MAPDFLPATIERARLYEQRGILRKPANNGPRSSSAASARRSTSRPRPNASAWPGPRRPFRRLPPPPPPGSGHRGRRAPPPHTLVSMDQEKLPRDRRARGDAPVAHRASRDRQRAGNRSGRYRRGRDVFRRGPRHQEIVPAGVSSRANRCGWTATWAPGADQLSTPPTWCRRHAPGRGEENRKTLRYYGYAVRVYYREELQDEGARPKELLEKSRALPTPFHKPAAGAPAATNPPPSRPLPV